MTIDLATWLAAMKANRLRAFLALNSVSPL
jgi:hypothetical protein